MIVAAHQPSYLPWLGYLEKMIRADVFVIMDHLQYESQNFQNRNRIKMNNGAGWITVPVEKGRRGDRICDKRIKDGDPNSRHHWRRRTWECLKNNYGKAPYWDAYKDEIEDIYARKWERLLDLDMHVLETARRWLGITVPVIMSSSLNLQGARSQMLVNLCRKVGADTYITGRGGSLDYLDIDLFERHQLSVMWQDFVHPVYPQRHAKLGFVRNLCFLDLILNCGPESRAILDRNLRAVESQEGVR